MAASNLSLLDVVENVLYQHKTLSFYGQSMNHIDQRCYVNLFKLLQRALFKGKHDGKRLRINYNHLRKSDTVFGASTPEIEDFSSIKSAFTIVAHLQNVWAQRAITHVSNVGRKMAFIAMVVNAFYSSPRQLINIFSVHDKLVGIYNNVYATVAMLVVDDVDKQHQSRSTDHGDIQALLTASNYVRDARDAVRLLCLPSIIERLSEYIVMKCDLGAIFLDDDLIADLLLLFTVQKIVDLREEEKDEIISLSPLIPPIVINDDEEDPKDRRRTQRFMQITRKTVACRLLKEWLQLTQHQVITELSVEASNNDKCVDVLQRIVESSPFLRRVHFVRRSSLFFKLFVKKRPHLDELNRGDFSRLTLMGVRHLHIEVEELQVFKVTTLLNKNMSLLAHLHVHIERSEDADLVTCLQVLAVHPSLESLEWIAKQAPKTNEGVYIELGRFIERREFLLESIRINILPERPRLQDKFIWASIQKFTAITPLLVLAIGLSNDTVDGQNIYEYLRKNRERRLENLLQIF